MSDLDLFLRLSALLAAYMFVIWLASVAIKDASIVDVFWGLGFALTAGIICQTTEHPSTRCWILCFCTWIWAVRLSLHLAMRKFGTPEDARYQAMRRKIGPSFPIVSLFLVFGLQGVIMMIVALPLFFGIRDESGVDAVTFIGIAVWSIGLAFEAIGDRQLERFKADPANAGKILDRGLWAWTRHPNYFGDSLIWWGLYFISLGDGRHWWTAIGPAVMTILLVWVSGVRLLENKMKEKGPAYADYLARTSSFVPWPPKRKSS